MELGTQLGSSPAEQLYSPILPPAPYILALHLLPLSSVPLYFVPSLYFLARHSRLTKPVPHSRKQHDTPPPASDDTTTNSTQPATTKMQPDTGHLPANKPNTCSALKTRCT